MSETQAPVSTIRVLLVDDHPTVLLGLRSVLSSAPDIDVVAGVTSGEECLQVLTETSPDVVVLDLGMPGQGGLETLRLIQGQAPGTRVLVLTASAEARDVTEAIRRGASGYLLKDTEGARLIEGVRGAGRGELPLDARITRHLLHDADDRPRIELNAPRSLFLDTALANLHTLLRESDGARLPVAADHAAHAGAE